MPSNIPGGYLIVNNEPIDSRFQHETTSSRDTLSIIRSYEGLITFIKQNKSLYVLTDTGSQRVLLDIIRFRERYWILFAVEQ